MCNVPIGKGFGTNLYCEFEKLEQLEITWSYAFLFSVLAGPDTMNQRVLLILFHHPGGGEQFLGEKEALHFIISQTD